MIIQTQNPLKEEYCQKGKCSAQIRQYREGSLPEDFACQKIFTRNSRNVLCSLPTIEGAKRSLPICGVYENFKMEKEFSTEFPQRPSPFSKYGYLSILEPAGIDRL